jgi:magnesium-transporting ATPase (P-type)
MQAEEKLKHYGPNALSEKKSMPWFIKLLLFMTGLFNYVMWIGSALAFIAFGIQADKTDKSNLILGIILSALVIGTGSLSYLVSSKSENLMAQFKNFIPPKAFVWRDGVRKEIEAIKLVPGDIVEIQIGDNIPADVVLFKTNEMKVNNASLTGESEELLR